MNLIRFALAFTIVLVGQDWVLSRHDESDSASISDKVEYAARDYRMAVYKAFRTDRPEFDARRATGEKLTKEWNASGNNSKRGELLVAWFQQATTAAEKHQASPPLPGSESETISKSANDAAPVILEPQTPPITPPINHPQAPTLNVPQESSVIAQPKSVIVQPSVTITQGTDSLAQQKETAPVNPFDAIKPTAPAQTNHTHVQEIIIPQTDSQPTEPARPMSVTVVPYGAMPESQIPRVDQSGRETPAPMGVTVVPYGAMPESELRPATPDLNTQQSTPKSIVANPFGASPQETQNPAPQITTDSAPSQRIELNPQPKQKFEPRDVQIFSNPLATTPAPKANGKKPDLDTMKALLEEKRNAGVPDQPKIGADLDDSELDKKMDLLQSLSKKLQLNDEQKEKLTEQLKPTDDGSKELETQLNLTELSAQIKAYQDNYRSLQAELSKPEIFTTDQTESVAETLKSLETSHKQMDLYKAIAPTEVKGALTSLGDPKSTWAMLKGQVESQRKKLNDDLNLTNAQRQQQLRRLDAVQEIIDGRAK